MKKFTSAIVILFSIASLPAFSANPPASGATCSKAGITQSYQGKKFTCIKNGKKLVWNKGVLISKGSQTQTPSNPPTSTSMDQENLLDKSCTQVAAERTTIYIFVCVSTEDRGKIWIKKGTESQYRISPTLVPSTTATQDWVDPLVGKPCTNRYERIPNQIYEIMCVPYNELNPTSSDSTLYWAQSNLPGNHKFPSPAPIKLTSNNYSVPTVPSFNIEQCQIKEISKVRNDLPSGFPRINSRTPSSGTLKWALIPVDFADMPGEKDFMSRIETQMKLASEWYEIVSEGKLKIEWVVAKNWVTLPGNSSDYKIPYSDDPTRSPEVAFFWKKAIVESDKYFDFTGIKTVNFILPKGQKIVPESGQGFPWDAAMKANPTNEGTLDSFTILGATFDLPGTTYWQYWAHEFGHAIGIPHLSGSRVWRQSAALDLMGNDNGPSKELSAWLRFVEGWLADERVYCQEKNSLRTTEVTLVPLNETKSGIKMAVVKLSETKALILESRRVTKFECVTESYRQGVLAYVYDATLGHNQDFLTAIEPAGRSLEKTACRSPDTTDSLLRTGDKITFDGISVEVLLHGLYDLVRIAKLD